MGITYNKEYTPKDRRILTNGPRDRQRKQAASRISSTADPSLVDELKEQIEYLKSQLSNPSSSGGLYTSEQVNDEIEKALKAETASLKSEVAILKSKIEGLENRNREMKESHSNELISLNELIKDKTLVIEELKNNKPVGLDEDKLAEILANAAKNIVPTEGGFIPTESDRPKMETTFIDPIEKKGKDIEKHFDVEDISIDKKEDINDKVSKLKALMRKMPSKIG